MATGLFVFISSIWHAHLQLLSFHRADVRSSARREELGDMLAEYGLPPQAASMAVLITGLALYDPVSQLVGGENACFSPATAACFAAAGHKGSVRSYLLRMVRGDAGGHAAAAVQGSTCKLRAGRADCRRCAGCVGCLQAGADSMARVCIPCSSKLSA